MSANYDLSALALKAICPNNELLYDDKGKHSVMVKIPKMTYAQLGLGSSNAVHPAFIVNGQEVDAIYISKYENIVMDGRAYSLPGEDPRTTINFDDAVAACTAKGAGWHLMTRAEWAMLALWCKANGTQPKGNNNWGKDTTESVYQALPTSYDSGDHAGQTAHVATGTGPLTWSHDGTVNGIWDLNGNVWEWVGGLRTVYGEVQVHANNNAADSSKSQGASSAQWMAINAATGALMTPNGSGTTSGSVKIDWVSGHGRFSTTITTKEDTGRWFLFENMDCDSTIGDNAKLLLQALALLKYDNTSGAYNGDYFGFNNGAAERSFNCGGYWTDGAGAGVFGVYGYGSRSFAGGAIGFRSAFVTLPTA